MTRQEALDAGFTPGQIFCGLHLAVEDKECQGHPAGPYGPMGETVYCDGSCQAKG